MRAAASRIIVIAAGLLAAAVVCGSPRPAAAYVRSRTNGTSGPCLFWGTDQPSFTLNDAGSQSAGAGPSLAAARASFQTWTQPSCTALTFTDQGTTASTDVGFDQTSSNNTNLVVFRERACQDAAPVGDPCFADQSCNNKYNCWDQTVSSQDTIALTTTTFSTTSGQIFDADIELNAAGFTFTTLDGPPCPSNRPVPIPPTCAATDVQNTLTHEIGHFIGLDHTTVAGAVMAPTAALGEISKRTLKQDDIDGLCVIYPMGSAPTSCSPTAPPSSSSQPKGCGCGAAEAAAPALGVVPLLLALRKRRPRSP